MFFFTVPRLRPVLSLQKGLWLNLRKPSMTWKVRQQVILNRIVSHDLVINCTCVENAALYHVSCFYYVLVFTWKCLPNMQKHVSAKIQPQPSVTKTGHAVWIRGIQLCFLLSIKKTLANRVICKLMYVEKGEVALFFLSVFNCLMLQHEQQFGKFGKAHFTCF